MTCRRDNRDPLGRLGQASQLLQEMDDEDVTRKLESEEQFWDGMVL